MEKRDRPAPPLAGERRPAMKSGWSARNLLSVDDLSVAEIGCILDLADYYAPFVARGAHPEQRLAGKTQINLFYE
ncbi:MAG: hypothetical protein WD076_04845, partial [Parvularculaceae bacterium]